MYDIYDNAPWNYIANGYLDPPKIPTLGPTLGPMTGGGTQQGYSFAYGYQGETMLFVTYNDFSSVYYAYDGLGRILNATGPPPSNYYARFSYYRNDHLMGVQYLNGLATNYTYTKLGQASTIKLKNGGTTLMSLIYLYNNTGTVASVSGWLTNTSNSQVTVAEKYAYDPLQRLVNSNVTSGLTKTLSSFAYDSVGNRAQQILNGITTTYSYNVLNNELTSSLASGVTTRYAYDNNGNLVSKTASNTQWSFSWSPSGNLLSATNNTVTKGLYAYDGLGRRVESIERGGTLFYGYLGTETLAELPSGLENNYVFAAGLRIAHYGSNPINFYHTDPLGSARMVTDQNKNIVFSDNYQPYGQDNSATGSETYKLTGKSVGQTTGLYHQYQRWRDRSIERFITMIG